MDSECYLHNCTLKIALEWLRTTLDDVRCIESQGILLYEVRHGGSPVTISFTESVEEGPYCSVHCGGKVLPWASDAEMARAAFAFSDLPVRWGTDSRDPTEWWQLDRDGERRITWD